jgi:hypothetical protein
MTAPTRDAAAAAMSSRRQRLHELVLALIARQDDLDLLDEAGPDLRRADGPVQEAHPGAWIDRHRRVVRRYQALVRSAATLDALIDQECAGA